MEKSMVSSNQTISNDLQIHSLKTALIVIDVQNDYCHIEGVFSKAKKVDLSHVQKAMEKLPSFIESCRRAGLPIIFVRTIHSDWTDSPSWQKRLEGAADKMDICRSGTWGSEFYGMQPRESDCIVIKHRYSAFIGTDLDLILRNRGIETLLMTGVTTNVCVETSARDGFNRNYDIILVEDCCGAHDEAEHEATLINIRKYFGKVATAQSVIEKLEKQGPLS